MTSLFYDPLRQAHVIVRPVSCSFCNRSIDDAGVHYRYWGRKASGLFLACMICARDLNKNTAPSVIAEIKTFMVYECLERQLVPVLERPPNLRPSKDDLSVFEAASLPSIKTVDKAWRSKRLPSIAGAEIGKPLLEDRKDVGLSDDEADVSLLDIVRQEPLLEDGERKLLRGGEDE